MVKVLTLLVMVLLALASVAGCFLLTGAIRSGEEQMAAGQKRLEQGLDTLEEGKVELAEGRQRLADGKEEYEEAEDSFFLVWADKLLNAGQGFKDGRKRVVKGIRKLAKGEDKVAAGEERIDVGELRLSRGSDRLKLARDMRMGCAVVAACLAALSIVLGFRWRRPLAGIFLHAKT
jgi:uncharacterized phage infection (PIP) family protein YhgE